MNQKNTEGLMKWVVEDPRQEGVWWPSSELKKMAWISDESIYKKASEDPVKFWADRAREGLHWFKEWDKAYEWTPPHFKWFVGGKINASYNAVDRHFNSKKKR